MLVYRALLIPVNILPPGRLYPPPIVQRLTRWYTRSAISGDPDEMTCGHYALRATFLISTASVELASKKFEQDQASLTLFVH